MNITVQWDDATENLLRVTFEDGWRADELDALTDRIRVMAAAVDYSFDVLVIVGATAPVGVNLYRIAQDLLLHHLPVNLNRIVVVTESLVIRMLNKTLLRVLSQLRGRLITVGSLDHAEAILQAYRHRDAGTGA